MSIENMLERIAVALEKMAAAMPVAINTPPSSVTVSGGTTTRAAKKTAQSAPVNAPVVQPTAEADPFAQPAAEEITIVQLEEKLRKHAAKYGTPTTLALMVKHGADKVKTTIKSVPTANYAALVAEVDADLAKVA